MAVQKMSKSVYVGMCKEIGTPQQAAYRREIANIREIWMNKVNERGTFKSMRSGSYREGFSFNDSDIDIMLWPTDHRVFWDFPQFYNTRKETVPRVQQGLPFFGYHWKDPDCKCCHLVYGGMGGSIYQVLNIEKTNFFSLHPTLLHMVHVVVEKWDSKNTMKLIVLLVIIGLL